MGDGKPPDPTAGTRRPLEVSSLSDGKKDSDSIHQKERVRLLTLTDDNTMMDEVMVEDIIEEELNHSSMPETTTEGGRVRNLLEQGPKPQPKSVAWGMESKKLFSEAVREESWYVADSDYEDVAEAIREDDNESPDQEDNNPLCTTVRFTPTKWRNYRREWRSAIMVKVLGRTFPYPIMAPSRLQIVPMGFSFSDTLTS
ncbi:unnamed protein product [Linum trigynum]|uniref:Uncharacterized protein n=1 Tax=Linum trigynum TaxID=586398 RepID=A0AAV2FCV8_9ROSI